MRQSCVMCGGVLIESEKVDGVCHQCVVKVDHLIQNGIKDWSDVDTHAMRVIVDRVRKLLDGSLSVIETLVMYHDNTPLIYAQVNLDAVGAINVTIRSDQLLALANTLA